MTNANGHTGKVPLLGQAMTEKAKMGSTTAAFVRKLDENGLADGTVTKRLMPNGQIAMNSSLARDQYMDAEEFIAAILGPLLAEIRQLREEVQQLRESVQS